VKATTAGEIRWRRDNGLKWLEADIGEARVCFTTRTGGVSGEPYESLNLGILTGDDREAVKENRHRIAAALEIDPLHVAMGRQVHGADLVFHEGGEVPPHFARPGVPPEEADGQLTDRPGTGLLVLVADCFPVALSGERGIAMLHCGWRGLAAGIIERAAARVKADSAVVGPGIGPCCFEVGPEVQEAFSGLGSGVSRGRMCDLPEIIRRLLAAAGVDTVTSAGICTSCEPEHFFSHRRDRGKTGRQAGIAWVP
jgi:YfiH family protein